MYTSKSWDEDKWNIHSSSYNSSKYGSTPLNDKKDDKKYHEQKYGSGEKNASSDYMRKEEHKDIESKDKGLFEELEEEKKEQKTEEEEVPFRAARQIFSEKRQLNEKKHEIKKGAEKNEAKTIEDAIKKAIEEEKKAIMMDN